MMYFKRLFSYARRYFLLYIIGTAFTVSAVIMEVLKPYLTSLIVDEGLKKKDFKQLGFWLLALLLVAVLRSLLWYGRSCAFHYSAQKILYDFRSQLFDKLQSQSFSFYDKVRTGLLMNRMVGDLESIRKFLTMGYAQLIECIIILIGAFSFMFSMSAKMAFMTMAIIPFMYLNTMKLANVLKPIFKNIRSAFEKLTSAVQENITGIRVVKSFNKEIFEKEKFYCTAKSFTNANIAAAEAQARYAPFSELINGIGFIIILLVGSYLTINGDITVGVLVAFYGYINILRGPVNNLNNLINQWENASASMEKIYELLDQEPMIQNTPNAITLTDIIGNIEFRNVYFKYNHSYVLQNISLQMTPGSVTAIMGATGSGKSTIINLISRFYDCTNGQILIDKNDVKDLELNSFRRHIGIILQETFLFSDTISNNIAFGKPGATREEIENAARIADAHHFIETMPDGYETMVEERGVGLSGGQRQRIAIARAIICNPRILILDDATSSVDMETEKEIHQTLKQVMKGRTTLMIAHRISTVKDADQIIFLDNGIIVERGTHEELLKMKGKYYQVFNEQYAEYNAYNRIDNSDRFRGGVKRFA